MEKKNVLFYDYNSYDANLAQYVNKMILGFESVPVLVPTNTTDTDKYYSPPTIFADSLNSNNVIDNTYESLIFVGVKPTKIFCDTARETRITIFDDGNIDEDYYLFCPNVFIVTKGINLSLVKPFVEYFEIYYHQQSKCNKTKIASGLFNLVNAFEKFCKLQSDENMLLIHLDAFVKSVSFKETNEIDFEPLEDVFDRIDTNPSNRSGEFNHSLITQKANKLLQNASTHIYMYVTDENEPITYTTIRIQADEATMLLIDRFVVNFYRSTGVNLFDFIEYYSINADNSVKVTIKNNTSLISPVEIKKYLELVEFIGQSNFDRINDYLTRNYPDAETKLNFNGTISTTVPNIQFFN